jgi:hypothetical protein
LGHGRGRYAHCSRLGVSAAFTKGVNASHSGYNANDNANANSNSNSNDNATDNSACAKAANAGAVVLRLRGREPD